MLKLCKSFFFFFKGQPQQNLKQKDGGLKMKGVDAIIIHWHEKKMRKGKRKEKNGTPLSFLLKGIISYLLDNGLFLSQSDGWNLGPGSQG